MTINFRKKILISVLTVFFSQMFFVFASNPYRHLLNTQFIGALYSEGENDNNTKGQSLYSKIQLNQFGLSQEAFEQGLAGYNKLLSAGRIKNDQVLTIADFSKPSGKKRLFVIDVKNARLLFHTYVAHGRNSGKELATSFSNDAESNKSSLGFFITGDTYNGKHGFSLQLFGEEKGINDNAFTRAIVMHSAEYVSENVVRMQGYVGRSLGCPALPVELNKPIIETIKNGSCLFLYSNNSDYAIHSVILNKQG